MSLIQFSHVLARPTDARCIDLQWHHTPQDRTRATGRPSRARSDLRDDCRLRVLPALDDHHRHVSLTTSNRFAFLISLVNLPPCR